MGRTCPRAGGDTDAKTPMSILPVRIRAQRQADPEMATPQEIR